MPNTPLPVPSPAALRALRGLLFGTSCSLALVAEDRRRRINCAQKILKNGDRIRSARNYHGGGAACLIALETDAATLSPEEISWRGKDGSRAKGIQQLGRTGRATRKALQDGPPTEGIRNLPSATTNAEEERTEPTNRSGRTRRKPRAASPTEAFTQPLSERPASFALKALEIQTKLPRSKAMIGVGDVDPEVASQYLLSSASSLDHASILNAIKMLRSVTNAQGLSAEKYAEILNGSALLCKTCQELGYMKEAQQVLELAVGIAQLDEISYFAHEPMPIIESLLPLDAGKVEYSDRPAFLEQLHAAASLFLPEFAKPRQKCPEGVVKVGTELIKRAISANSKPLTEEIYLKIVSGQADLGEFLPWYLNQLQGSRNYSWITSSFLRYPKTETPTPEWLRQVGDVVVDAVTCSHGLAAEKVLRKLHAMQQGSGSLLRTTWVAELLYQHWKTQKNQKKTYALFAELFEADISVKIQHPNGAYRTMIQISLEADDTERAESYLRHLASRDPGTPHSSRVLGLFAQAKARKQDWDGVWQIFQNIRTTGKQPLKDAGPVFVPILQEYAQTHTMTETEDWLRVYIDELGLQPCRAMVTLLAKLYGERRDVQSFVAWLDYCISTGMAIDAGFGNAILRSCWKRWKLPWEELRMLYLKLCKLNPNFEDDSTRQLMELAALAPTGCTGKRGGIRRATSLKRGPIHSTLRNAFASEEEVWAAMKQSSIAGRPQRAAAIYNKALRLGMPPSERCLKLAVSTTAQHGKGTEISFKLLKSARPDDKGTDAAAVHILIAQLDTISTKARPELVREEIRAAVRHFEEGGRKVTDSALNRAAFHLYRANHVTAAIQLSLAAADLAGQVPGYNMWNFSVLVLCFARQVDAPAMSMVIDNVSRTRFRDERMVYDAVKRAGKVVGCYGEKGAEKTRVAHAAVQRGLRILTGERVKAAVERRKVEMGVLEIMKKAAVQAGCEPVALKEVREKQPKKVSIVVSAGGKEDPWSGLEEASRGREPKAIAQASF